VKTLLTQPRGRYIPVFLFVFFGIGFSFAAVSLLAQGYLLGLAFLPIGLFYLVASVLAIKETDAEFDERFIYLRRCFVKDALPLSEIKGLIPCGPRRSAYWIEFHSESKFGKRVLIKAPRKWSPIEFPFEKAFEENQTVNALLEAIHRAGEANPKGVSPTL
jgi:hypothetical protein